jgi:DNA-binding XRE family transcriptional regulator
VATSVKSRRSDPKKEQREAWLKFLKRIDAKLAGGEELTLHEFVVNALRTRGDLKLTAIGARIGISNRTIEKIASGESPDPLVSNCEKLATYFRRRKRDSDKALERV